MRVLGARVLHLCRLSSGRRIELWCASAQSAKASRELADVNIFTTCLLTDMDIATSTRQMRSSPPFYRSARDTSPIVRSWPTGTIDATVLGPHTRGR